LFSVVDILPSLIWLSIKSAANWQAETQCIADDLTA
jgi:hypothetical protein